MDKSGIIYTLNELRKKSEELYDLWQTLPKDVQNEFEFLFADNQGSGYNI